MNQPHGSVGVVQSLPGSGREKLRESRDLGTGRKGGKEGKGEIGGRERESAASAQMESDPRQTRLSARGAALRSRVYSVPAFAGGRRRGALWK